MLWIVEFDREFEREFDQLPPAVQDELLAQVHLIRRGKLCCLLPVTNPE